MRLEVLVQLQNPVSSSVIEPATIQLVAYYLNQLLYRVPPDTANTWKKTIEAILNPSAEWGR
jgi:hypothetical protein